MLTKLGDLRDVLLIAFAVGLVITLALSGAVDHDGVKTLASVLIGIIGGAVTLAPKATPGP